MKPFLIIAIVIPIIIATVFAVFFVQSMPQQNLEETPEEQNKAQEFEPNCSIQCLVYDPVCGEDRITYACGVEDAACHGVEIEHEGECVVSTSTPELVTSKNDCPIENFLEVSNYDGAGSQYPKPFLNVYCDEEFVYVESNGIPHYSFVQTTPNALSEQDYLWEIPLNPEISSNNEIPLLGVIGFSVNGLPIYGPNEGAFPDPYGDPVYNEILDSCLGHTAQRGDYHYHAFELSCLSLNIGDYKESPILGYALDGFPIYGAYGCLDEQCSEIIEFQSSWIKTGDPTTYAWDNYEYKENSSPKFLDQCNGRYDEKLGYHYRATENFPYLLGCYSGEINSDNVTPIQNNQPQTQNTIPAGCPMPGDPPPREGLPEGCPLPGHPPPR